jgi:hypothetical protein
MQDCWAAVLKGGPWRRICAQFGIEGQVRVVEVTWGDTFGWHPHLHLSFRQPHLPPSAAPS